MDHGGKSCVGHFPGTVIEHDYGGLRDGKELGTRQGSNYQNILYLSLNTRRRSEQCLERYLVVILIVALFAALPRWSHSREWGYVRLGEWGWFLSSSSSSCFSGALRYVRAVNARHVSPTEARPSWRSCAFE